MTQAHISPNSYAYPLIIRQLLHSCMQTAPEQEIVTGDLWRYTYRDFAMRIAKLAAGLRDTGVQPGQTVAVMNWDCHRYLECFFAIPMMGAVLHTINIRLSPEQMLYTINHAEDDVILVHEEFVPLLEEIVDRIERPCRLVLITDQENHELPPGFTCEYESMLQSVDQPYDFEDLDENTVATTFYTTGTTGDPKGVFYTHRQLVLHTMGMVSALAPVAQEVRLHCGDVYMPMTPMFHVHGWGMPYVATMLGLKQVYPGRYDPAKLARYIEREGATFSHCVPTILHMLLSAPEAIEADLSGLKVVIGGSALPQGLAQVAIDMGIQVFAAYGMSETGPIATVADTRGIDHSSTQSENLSPRGKTGKPTALVDLRVVDSELNDIARGGDVTGEVVLRTPWLTQGYTGNPEASDELWTGGYLHTGDVGYIDDTGALMITDRMKDVIKSGGEWISSIELENIVSQVDGVGEAAAIGIADDHWGERPMMVVSLRDDSPALSADDIRNAVADEVTSGALPKWAIPVRVEFVEQIDKTSVGKLDKKVLRARYSN